MTPERRWEQFRQNIITYDSDAKSEFLKHINKAAENARQEAYADCLHIARLQDAPDTANAILHRIAKLSPTWCDHCIRQDNQWVYRDGPNQTGWLIRDSWNVCPRCQAVRPQE